jgi:hypothetical protein
MHIELVIEHFIWSLDFKSQFLSGINLEIEAVQVPWMFNCPFNNSWK